MGITNIVNGIWKRLKNGENATNTSGPRIELEAREIGDVHIEQVINSRKTDKPIIQIPTPEESVKYGSNRKTGRSQV